MHISRFISDSPLLQIYHFQYRQSEKRSPANFESQTSVMVSKYPGSRMMDFEHLAE
jgi:hypothetical protein